MTTTTLKLFGLLFMTLDHIGEFFPNTPIIFRWIGRLSYPLFAFCCVQGVLHTKSKKKYLGMLYIFHIIMIILGAYFNSHYATNDGTPFISNNIFSTLFQLALLLCVLEMSKKKNYKKTVLLYILYQLLMLFCHNYFLISTDFNWWQQYAVHYLFCNLFWQESNWFMIFLGVVFYFSYRTDSLKEPEHDSINQNTSQQKAAFMYILFILIYYLIELFDIVSRTLFRIKIYFGNTVNEILVWILSILGADPVELNTFTPFSTELLLYENYQWMMIFAFPFFLFYNGQHGRKIKWFFYLYYPIHIILLFLLSKTGG